MPGDDAAIAAVIARFFAAFDSARDTAEAMADLRSLFVPGAIVLRACGFEPEAMTVEEFIEPRARLLADGTLTDFSERATTGRIDVFGDIAAWFGGYDKSGRHAGGPYAGDGMKSAQLVRTRDGWRLSAVAWDDRRDGVEAAASYAWPGDADSPVDR